MTDSALVITRAEYVLDAQLTLDKATRSFFCFWRPSKDVKNRRILEHCFFFDLHIPVYVEDWPQQPGPAHPGLFEDAFPAILKNLIEDDRILTLYVGSSDRDSFDELTFIRDILVPQRTEYVLLPSRLGPPYPARCTLLFQWPLDSFQYIVDNWFMSPQVTIEGYVSRQPCLGKLAELYFEPYGTQNMWNVLELIEFGFKLWRDNNGLFLLSDKLDEEAFRKRLASPDLNEIIRAAISAAQHQI